MCYLDDRPTRTGREINLDVLGYVILDEIDDVLAGHFGHSDEELDFVINYDYKFRKGVGLTEQIGNEDEAAAAAN